MNIAGAFNEFSNPAGMWDLLVKNNYFIYIWKKRAQFN